MQHSPSLTTSRDYYFPIDLGYSFFSSSCAVILFSFSCLSSKLEFGEGPGVGTNLSSTKNHHSTLFDKWIIMKREACLITRKIYDKITMSADEHNKMVNIMFHILSGPVVDLYLGLFSGGPGACSWIIWMSGFIKFICIAYETKNYPILRQIILIKLNLIGIKFHKFDFITCANLMSREWHFAWLSMDWKIFESLPWVPAR